MRSTTVALTLLLLSAAIAGAQETGKIFQAPDKKTQITVPSNWTVLQLNQAAEIQVGNEKDGAYLIVLNELKADLYGWNLDKHSRVTLGHLLGTVDFPVVTGPKAITIGGRPAVQYEIRGAAKGRNIVYVHTTVDGPKYFSQILAWTLPSREEAEMPQLLIATSSFKEVP